MTKLHMCIDVLQALSDDGTEVFVKKATPAPLNEELCATIQTEFRIPVLHHDQITLQFQVGFCYKKVRFTESLASCR